MALQNPERYRDVLEEGVEDWLNTARQMLATDGVPDPPAGAIATLILATTRGLMLDLLQTGDAERVDAAMDLLAGLAQNLAATG